MYDYQKQIYLIHDDAFNRLKMFKDSSISVILTDPPYFLSNNGISNTNGQVVSVNKGKWDSGDFSICNSFYTELIPEFKRVLKKDGSVWIFGSMHNIFSVGYQLQRNDFKLLNLVTWAKQNPPENLSHRMFTHASEMIVWAKRTKLSHQTFNYDQAVELNHGRQMTDVWETSIIKKSEKKFGYHPTQKPLALIERMILTSTKPNDLILDPFIGSGTTAMAALKHGRRVIGIDQDKKYLEIAKRRIENAN